MGVLEGLREANATLKYTVEESERFDIKRYITDMGGYNESIVDQSLFSSISDGLRDTLLKHGIARDTVSEELEKESAKGTDQMDESDESTKPGTASEDSEPRSGVAALRMQVAEMRMALRARGLKVSGTKVRLKRALTRFFDLFAVVLEKAD